MKLHIVGTSGVGKSTLARQLANGLGCKHIELDNLYWGGDWQPRSDVWFQAQSAAALRADAWVADGNYSQVRELIWQQADLIIWLDYSLSITLSRLAWRNFGYVLGRQKLWESKNCESWGQLLGRNSIVLRALRSHYRRRRLYEQLLHDPQSPPFVRLSSPLELHGWLHHFWVHQARFGASYMPA